MKLFSISVIAAMSLLAGASSAQTPTPQSVVQESIAFLRTSESQTLHAVDFDFSITDGTSGVISGGYGNVSLFLDSLVSKSTGKHFFLTTRAPAAYHCTRVTESGQTFSSTTHASALVSSTFDPVLPLNISYKTNGGTTTKSVDILSHFAAIRIGSNVAVTSTQSITSEYILYGSTDPANPKNVATVRIRLRKTLIGG